MRGSKNFRERLNLEVKIEEASAELEESRFDVQEEVSPQLL